MYIKHRNETAGSFCGISLGGSPSGGVTIDWLSISLLLTVPCHPHPQDLAKFSSRAKPTATPGVLSLSNHPDSAKLGDIGLNGKGSVAWYARSCGGSQPSSLAMDVSFPRQVGSLFSAHW